MASDPSSKNPNWSRPNNWPYPEDWGSEAWELRMKESNRKSWELRKLHGFINCPSCKMTHTNYTLMCRECGHKTTLPTGS